MITQVLAVRRASASGASGQEKDKTTPGYRLHWAPVSPTLEYAAGIETISEMLDNSCCGS